jgi:hypothetical protein
MLWLTYKQHRPELSALLIVAVALAALVAVAGIQELALRESTGIESCLERLRDPACGVRFVAYNDQKSPLPFGLYMVMLAFPALVAAFRGVRSCRGTSSAARTDSSGPRG